MPISNPGKRNAFTQQQQPSIDDINPHLRVTITNEGEPVVARPTPLTEITPDPRQPRRLVPSVVRQLAPSGATPAQIISFWENYTRERIGSYEPAQYILGDTDPTPPNTEDETVLDLFKLYSLAGSIYRDGLLHPITVARKTTGGYLIEVGERRFWAYNLLNLYAPEPARFAAIPAQRLDAHSVWRQATENTNRSELNAIQKARQLALLLMDMWTEEREFKQFEACASDLEFYAQAKDLNSRKGMLQRLLDAMGVTNRNTLSYYKKLLSLNEAEWNAAESENKSLKELLRDLGVISEPEEKEVTFNALNISPSDQLRQSRAPISPTPPAWQDEPARVPLEPRPMKPLVDNERVIDVESGEEARVMATNDDGTVQIQFNDGRYRSQLRVNLMPVRDAIAVFRESVGEVNRPGVKSPSPVADKPAVGAVVYDVNGLPGERVPVYQNVTQPPPRQTYPAPPKTQSGDLLDPHHIKALLIVFDMILLYTPKEQHARIEACRIRMLMNDREILRSMDDYSEEDAAMDFKYIEQLYALASVKWIQHLDEAQNAHMSAFKD